MKAYNFELNIFHRKAVEYIIGVHPDKESRGCPEFERTLKKLAEEYKFNWQNMSRKQLEEETEKFMRDLSDKEMLKLLKYFQPKQDSNFL